MRKRVTPTRADVRTGVEYVDDLISGCLPEARFDLISEHLST